MAARFCCPSPKKLALSFAAILLSFLPRLASAAADGADMAHITVTAATRDFQAQAIKPETLTIIEPMTAADVLGHVPGGFIQVNSRGEAQLYMRAAGERQTALFLDGALLNVPWDFNSDLSLIPGQYLGSLRILQGADTTLYGINTTGGAILLSPASGDGERFAARIAAGPHGQREARLGGETSRGPWRLQAGVQHSERDHTPLPADANLPFSQPDAHARTGSAQKITSALVRAEYHASDHLTVGATVLGSNAAKAVAPESHKNPATTRVRYWRLPDERSRQFILWGQSDHGAALAWDGSVWFAKQDGQIHSYSDVSYKTLDAIEDSRNRTAGLNQRLTLTLADRHQLAVNVLGFTSGHDERDRTPSTAPSTAAPAFTHYRERALSLGTNYSYQPNSDWLLRLAGAANWLAAPATGDKPPIAGFSAIDLQAAVERTWSGGDYLRLTYARKSRFPTLRELFGVALKKFLINPGLKPETAHMVEATAGGTLGAASWDLVAFWHDAADTIDQQNVKIDGTSRQQRINLPGHRVLGLGATGAVDLSANLSLRGNITWMDINAGADWVITERPNLLGHLIATYRHGPFRFDAELDHQGRLFSRDDDDRAHKITASTQVHGSVNYALLEGASTVEAFVKLYNLTDGTRYKQLGLPDAGRTLLFGLAFKY